MTVTPMDLGLLLDARIAWTLAALEAAGPPAPLDRAAEVGTPMTLLAQRFGLDAAAREVLWFLVGLQLAPAAWQRGVELAGHDDGVPLVVLRDIMRHAGVPILAATLSALERHALVTRAGGPVQPRYAAAARVVEVATGELRLAEDVAAFARLVLPGEVAALAPADLDLGDLAAHAPLLVVTGRPGSGRRTAVLRAVHAQRRPALLIEARQVLGDPLALGASARAIARECALFDAVPIVVASDEGPAAAVAHDGAVLLACADAWPGALALVARQAPSSLPARDVRRLVIDDLAFDDRRACWRAALAGATEPTLDAVAAEFAVTPAVIAAVGRRLGAAPPMAAIAAAVVDHVADDLRRFATPRRVPQTWADLVLPRDEAAQVRGLVSRLRHRHTVYGAWGFGAKVGAAPGVAALFSGPPGTGKTMAASLVAAEAGVRLMQVDLARVVSKYIGETEANLAALFDAADGGGVALLFDEADSLFGRRTEVKSSNDRHANMETNFILQRLETFSGLVLLTTNHENAIDPAVLRRLAVHVRLPLPDVAQRARLWRALLPTAAPIDGDLDLATLARDFPLTGGYIKNAVVSAAFAAAAEGRAIDQAALERAASRELEATGRVATTARAA